MPKRKAGEDFSLPSSPSKRTTRSSARTADEAPSGSSPRRPPPKRATRNTKSQVETQAETSPPSARTTKRNPRAAPQRRGADSAVKAASNTSSKDTLEAEDSDSSDELNLSPPKNPVQPVTPPPKSRPRVVMHSVEITTPAFLSSKKLVSTTASPAPSGIHAQRASGKPQQRPPSTPSRLSPLKPGLPPDKASSSTFPSTPSRKTQPAAPQASPSRLPRVQLSSPGKPDPQITASPSKSHPAVPQSPTRLPRVLPPHLIPCLQLQKRATLSALQDNSSTVVEESGSKEPNTNNLAFGQLRDLLAGTVNRGEGNSCLLLGPRGSGKTSLVEQAILTLPSRPIILRLSGHAQHNDRLALREIARQLSQQTGKSFLSDSDGDPEKLDEGDNPFLDAGPSISLPPPSHLPALISVLPTLSRPTIVILDAFDLFALHARQSLLYCLLDTVQSCRVGQGTNGITVIGVTTRIDTINLLEKRVKSRFSGRILRTAPPANLADWTTIAERVLSAPIDSPDGEWPQMWKTAVEKFLSERMVSDSLKQTFSLTRDVRMLKQILINVVAELCASTPFPTPSQLASALATQRWRVQFSNLHTLSYPSACLLIAAMHADTAGHDIVNFEMLYDSFRDQFRASAAAPVQIEGGSIGMARCTREVLMSGFEQLLAARIFVSIAAPSPNIAPQFVCYRCMVRREDVKKAVDKMGQTNLKKWLSKAQ